MAWLWVLSPTTSRATNTAAFRHGMLYTLLIAARPTRSLRLIAPPFFYTLLQTFASISETEGDRETERELKLELENFIFQGL